MSDFPKRVREMTDEAEIQAAVNEWLWIGPPARTPLECVDGFAEEFMAALEGMGSPTGEDIDRARVLVMAAVMYLKRHVHRASEGRHISDGLDAMLWPRDPHPKPHPFPA